MMSYENLMFVHLATVLPSFVIETINLLIKKATSMHKKIGKIYIILMLFTAIVTLFMPALVGLDF